MVTHLRWHGHAWYEVVMRSDDVFAAFGGCRAVKSLSLGAQGLGSQNCSRSRL